MSRGNTDQVGYLRKLLRYAEHNNGMPPARIFHDYARRINAQTSTPQELRDEYVAKLRVLCDEKEKQLSTNRRSVSASA